MIKKLKFKFVMINMILVGIVLLLVFSIVFGNTYRTGKEEISHALEMAVSDAMEERDMPVNIGIAPDKNRQPESMKASGYDGKPVSYAAVVVQAEEDGSFSQVPLSMGQNASMEQELLERAVQSSLEGDADFGRLTDMGLFYRKVQSESGWLIAFADAGHFDDTVSEMALTVIVLFILCMAALFLISLTLAKVAVAPVRKALEQQQRFVADASHELKTPLTVILANSEILLEQYGPDAEGAGKWIESTRQEAVHMKRLVEDLLFLAKSDEETAHREFSKESISLSDVAAGVALQFEPMIFEAGAQLQMEIKNDIYMKADATQIRQLVHILLDNAVKYAAPVNDKSRIVLKLSEEGGKISLSVANTGERLSDEDMEHIFERFYRSDKARTSEGGFGLGLSIAKTIAEKHNGHIKAQSGEIAELQSAGTKFTVVFSR